MQTLWTIFWSSESKFTSSAMGHGKSVCRVMFYFITEITEIPSVADKSGSSFLRAQVTWLQKGCCGMLLRQGCWEGSAGTEVLVSCRVPVLRSSGHFNNEASAQVYQHFLLNKIKMRQDMPVDLNFLRKIVPRAKFLLKKKQFLKTRPSTLPCAALNQEQYLQCWCL